jgi:hypothetical protein
MSRFEGWGEVEKLIMGKSDMMGSTLLGITELK